MHEMGTAISAARQSWLLEIRMSMEMELRICMIFGDFRQEVGFRGFTAFPRIMDVRIQCAQVRVPEQIVCLPTPYRLGRGSTMAVERGVFWPWAHQGVPRMEVRAERVHFAADHLIRTIFL